MLFDQEWLAMLRAMHPDRSNFNVKTVGFTYKLTRKYSKFIYIYYIPRQDSFLIETSSNPHSYFVSAPFLAMVEIE